jgi:hypothetical protein
MGTQRRKMKGTLSWLVVGLVVPEISVLVGLVQNIFFSSPKTI